MSPCLFLFHPFSYHVPLSIISSVGVLVTPSYFQMGNQYSPFFAVDNSGIRLTTGSTIEYHAKVVMAEGRPYNKRIHEEECLRHTMPLIILERPHDPTTLNSTDDLTITNEYYSSSLLFPRHHPCITIV